MRRKIIAANWKMYEEYEAGVAMFSEILDMVGAEVSGRQQTIICAPFIHLHTLSQMAIGTSKLFVGAQNCHQADEGAYTGEISAKMIRSAGAQYVIIGHSERRKYFGESNELVAEKTSTALKNYLKPIVCIGETAGERQARRQFDIVSLQLNAGTFHLNKDMFSQLVIAYEPIWAIGAGVSASAGSAQEIHAFIRKQIAARYGADVAGNTCIIYGGSCQRENAAGFFSQPDIDGGLIGGASLHAREFVDIVKLCN